MTTNHRRSVLLDFSEKAGEEIRSCQVFLLSDWSMGFAGFLPVLHGQAWTACCRVAIIGRRWEMSASERDSAHRDVFDGWKKTAAARWKRAKNERSHRHRSLMLVSYISFLSLSLSLSLFSSLFLPSILWRRLHFISVDPVPVGNRYTTAAAPKVKLLAPNDFPQFIFVEILMSTGCAVEP